MARPYPAATLAEIRALRDDLDATDALIRDLRASMAELEREMADAYAERREALRRLEELQGDLDLG
jgi:phage shock protein A